MRRFGIRPPAARPTSRQHGYNIFCSGLAHLVNGKVFTAGGNKDPQFDGIVQTHLFDPATNTWAWAQHGGGTLVPVCDPDVEQ